MEADYDKVMQSGDRFEIPHVKVKRLFTSRVRKKGLTQKSLMVTLSPVWAGFDSDTKNAWTLAGAESSMSGWKAFVQDTAVRIANDLTGYATPNVLYQSRVGRMTVESPALGLTIAQLHPQSYYISKKVAHKKSEYTPVLIQENLSMPVDIAISYKTDFTSLDVDSKVRFFVIVYSSYQGRTLENLCEIDMPLTADWTRATASISGVIGAFRGYTAFVQIHNARGTLLFDNVKIFHSGLNYARDPFCNSIQTSFTKAFYQVPKNWGATDLTTGAFFRSVYHEQ